MLMENLGQKIKSLRQERRWTQGDIAKKLNITIAAFSKIETQVTDVSLSRLKQLAGIFEVSLGELLGINDENQAVNQSDEVKQLREANEKLSLKISHLQEYIITLYEELHKHKLNIKND